jgi:hypothetical protein
MAGDSEKSRLHYLDHKQALALAFLPIAVFAVLEFTPLKPYIDSLTKLDLWTSSGPTFRWLLTGLLLLITFLIFIKHWSYYYRPLTGPKGGAFKATIGIMSPLELTLDRLIIFTGGLLFVLAYFLPTYWPVGYTIYCLFGLLRCNTTFNRGRIAAFWKKQGERKLKHIGPLSTFPQYAWPNKFIGKIRLSWKSLDTLHEGADGKHRPAGAILTGWRWSFQFHLLYGLVTSLITIITVYMEGPNMVALITYLVFLLGPGILFFLLSNYSLALGERRWQALNGIVRHRVR